MKCAKCLNPALIQALFERGYHACLRCHWLCWQTSVLDQIVTPRFAATLGEHLDKRWPQASLTCPTCSSYLEKIRIEATTGPTALSDNLNENIATMVFGMPYLENLRNFSDIPYKCLIAAGIVTATSLRGFSDDKFSTLLTFDPGHSGLLALINLFSIAHIRGYLWRFKAPNALVLYIVFNLYLALQPGEQIAGWGHLGGIIAGGILHLTFNKGAASKAYVQMERQAVKRAIETRNWRDTG